MVKRSHFLFRKSLHLLLGTIFFLFIHWFFTRYGKENGLYVILGILVLFLLIDFFRIERGILFGMHLVKEKEKYQFHGATLALGVAVLLFGVFDFSLAFTAMVISIYGDCAASLVGKFFGKHAIRKEKTLEGFAAYLIVGSLLGSLFLPWHVALLMALVASSLEIVCTHTEDNFLVPIVIGFVGFLLLL